MLSKKHRYDEQILKSIPQQRQARCSSLKKFGEVLHQCLRKYREEYFQAFGEHYTYVEVEDWASEKTGSA